MNDDTFASVTPSPFMKSAKHCKETEGSVHIGVSHCWLGILQNGLRQERMCPSRKAAHSNQSVDEFGPRAAVGECHRSPAVPGDSGVAARTRRRMVGGNTLTDTFLVLGIHFNSSL